MKRIITCLLLLFSIFVLVGCKDSPEDIPENLLRSKEGSRWINDIDRDMILEIKIIKEPQGVDPAYSNPREIMASSDKDVISYVFNAYYSLEVEAVNSGEEQNTGGQRTIVEFCLNDGSVKELIFINRDYYDGHNCYRVKNIPSFPEGTNYHIYFEFGSISGIGEVSYSDNNSCVPLIVCDIPVEELKFVLFFDYVPSESSRILYTVGGDFGTLFFIENDVFFKFRDEIRLYYRLVGKNLEELIDEYSVK